MYNKTIKPILDFIFSIILFVLLLPFFFGVTLFLLFVNNGNPFFLQNRTGINGKPFRIIKFKTMIDKRDNSNNQLPDSERITKIGKFLRKFSLDEIPQLINVIKGDMSFVGPRPLLTDYAHLYNHFQNQRHHVKPGITGWAQVNGRNAISWDKKFELDVFYVSNISLILDTKIFFLTLKKVFFTKEVLTDNPSEIEPFYGQY